MTGGKEKTSFDGIELEGSSVDSADMHGPQSLPVESQSSSWEGVSDVVLMRSMRHLGKAGIMYCHIETIFPLPRLGGLAFNPKPHGAHGLGPGRALQCFVQVDNERLV